MVEDEPQYEVVLKMVLWDETKEVIFRRLEVNKITGKRAQAIYQTARNERIRILRSDGLKALALGVAAIVSGVVLFYQFKLNELAVTHFGEGINALPFLPWLLAFLSAILCAFGLWKIVQGSIEAFFAGLKKGSIADR